MLMPGPGAPLLRGDVVVLRGAYRGHGQPAGAGRLQRPAVAGPAKPCATSTRVRLDIALSTEDDMVVDNNYGRFEAGANVRLQGTVGRPGVTGRADLREGGEMFVLGGSTD